MVPRISVLLIVPVAATSSADIVGWRIHTVTIYRGAVTVPRCIGVRGLSRILL